MSHTPGPWNVEPFPNGSNMWSALIGSHARNQIAAVVMLPCKEPSDYSAECAVIEESANARLIAAAPELLAALKEIAELTSKRQLPLTVQINDAARAAIAKAEGRS